MSQKLATQKGEKKTHNVVLPSNFDNTRTLRYFFSNGEIYQGKGVIVRDFNFKENHWMLCFLKPLMVWVH